jgi:hypothetical protein
MGWTTEELEFDSQYFQYSSAVHPTTYTKGTEGAFIRRQSSTDVKLTTPI